MSSRGELVVPSMIEAPLRDLPRHIVDLLDELRRRAREMCGSQTEADVLVARTLKRALKEADGISEADIGRWLIDLLLALYLEQIERPVTLGVH